MATPAWNEIDNFQGDFPEYTCAFIDILGYKEKAKLFFEKQFNLYGRINRAFSTASTLQLLTSYFVDCFNIRIEVISDSIIMTQPRCTHGIGPILPFSCYFASLLSFEGLFLRGGIASGRHVRRTTEQGHDFMASEALIRAYELESKVAVYPRILIDSELARSSINEERGIIIRDGEHYIVHFAHHIINREAANSNDVFKEMEEIYSSIGEASDERVRIKLQWLLDYYYWTISTNASWDETRFSRFRSTEQRLFDEYKG